MNILQRLRTLSAYRHTNNRKTHRHSERGNVLFYILIAVALLAALSYAVSSTGQGGGSADISDEKAGLAAAEILEYSNNIASAATQLKLRGCNDTEISFDNAVSATDYSNTNAPGDNTCDIFHVSGGGLQYTEPQAEWLDSDYSAEDFYAENLFTGTACVDFIGTGNNTCSGDGIDAADMILIIPFIREGICQQLNRLTGFADASAPPPTEADDAWGSSPAFQGAYAAPEQISEADNKKSGCFEGASGSRPNGGYHFYKILLAR